MRWGQFLEEVVLVAQPQLKGDLVGGRNAKQAPGDRAHLPDILGANLLGKHDDVRFPFPPGVVEQKDGSARPEFRGGFLETIVPVLFPEVLRPVAGKRHTGKEQAGRI